MAKQKVADKGSVTTAELLATFQKDMGETIGSFGGKLMEADRCPTGLFELDLALGGGFPRGRCSTIFGPESSNKTNIALCAIRQNQILRPDQTNVFVAIEPFDSEWAKSMGVDTDKLIVMVPGYAEQVVDIVENFLYADDCGLVAIDSLAAMVTTQEIDSSADKANVGGSGLAVGKLVRKTTRALQEAEKKGKNQPTLLYINQIRHKIGVMFGDPETTPGGNAPLFQSAVRLRVYGKSIMDSKVNAVLPVRKEVQFIVRKWKVPILSTHGKFEMATQPHKGLQIGECNDFGTIIDYLKAFDCMHKVKGGWEILGDVYATQAEFQELVQKNKTFGNDIRKAIIERLLNGETIDPGEFDPETGEVYEEGDAA